MTTFVLFRRGFIGLLAVCLGTALLSSCSLPHVVPCNVVDLIQHINDANATPATTDTLVLTQGCVYPLDRVDNETEGANGLPTITSRIIINGNDAVIRRIVDGCGVPVQVAGGVRDAAAVDRWAGAGAARIVIGTLAVEQPDAVEAAVRKHGDRIAVAVDVRGGKPAVKGWLETADATAEDFVRDMAMREVRHFIYTDISRDGMMQHLDYAALRGMLGVLADTGTPATLIYSGGVTSIEDIIALNEYGIEGAIVGRALYDGRIDLREALQALVTGNGTG